MGIVKKIAKQVSWQILGKFISATSTLIVLGLIARNYGEEGLGIFTLTFAYLAFFNLAADLGLNAFYLPRLKNNPDGARELLNFRIIWSLVLVILANALSYLLPFQNAQFTLSVFLVEFIFITFPTISCPIIVGGFI